MTEQYVLPLDSPQAVLETVGGKGASLARLTAAGLPVPDGFHVTTAAYERFVVENDLQQHILEVLKSVDVSQPDTLESASHAINERFLQAQISPELAAAIARAYQAMVGEHPVVAVRSSATAEDLPELSFAGQQETFLNIHGVEAVLKAVKRCWASLWTARAIGYRERNAIDQGAVRLAVVVQRLVPAEAAGILFTANPINGQRGQAMVSAAWGLGEAIVGGLVTPDTLVVDKSNGAVISRETADKEVMTVLLESHTEERPVTENLRLAPVLDDSQAARLVRLGMQIEALYGMPMDIEWAWLDGEFAILQARPITALPEPETPDQLEWNLPHPKGQYMRASVVDILPDPVSPLFETLGIPSAVSAMLRVGKVVTRSKPVLPRDYFCTINNYVYMDAYFPPRAWWWVITGLMPAMPRMMRTGVRYYRETAVPQYVEAVSRWQDRSFQRMPAAEIWDGVHEILDAAMDYLTMLMFATMGASAGSEGLFTGVYNKLVHKDGDPPATTFLMGYDSLPIQAEKSLYDLAAWCRQQEALVAYILETPSEELAHSLESDQPPEEVSVEDWQALRQRFQEHLSRFGHIIYTLDFAHPLPLDQTEPMLETCKMYLRGEGTDPHKRQGDSEEKRQKAVETMQERLKGPRGWLFRKTLGWAQSLAEVRETALANIGLGYPLIRQMLRELGTRFVQAGAIREADEIYWLELDEVNHFVNALELGEELDDMSAQIRQRKVEWETAKRVTPPPILPPKKKYMGFDTDIWVAAGEEDQVGNTLKGVPTSAGKVTARACVLHGPEDFHRMTPGAVLVAGTTTPAWTPLFAMASAVVTDIGGPLSHGSIVAREYGIPAVMGVGVATRRIQNGQTITVDGGAGLVILGNGKDG
jgi:phosphohistidine swiveling domain-containing protein